LRSPGGACWKAERQSAGAPGSRRCAGAGTGESRWASTVKPSASASCRRRPRRARASRIVHRPSFTRWLGSSNCGLTSTTPSAPSRRRKASERSIFRAATKLTSTVKKSNGPGATASDRAFQSVRSKFSTRASAASRDQVGHVPRLRRSRALPTAEQDRDEPAVDAPTSTARPPRTQAASRSAPWPLPACVRRGLTRGSSFRRVGARSHDRVAKAALLAFARAREGLEPFQGSHFKNSERCHLQKPHQARDQHCVAVIFSLPLMKTARPPAAHRRSCCVNPHPWLQLCTELADASRLQMGGALMRSRSRSRHPGPVM